MLELEGAASLGRVEDVRWLSGVAMLFACILACDGEGEGGDEGDDGSGGSAASGGSSNGGTSSGGTANGGTSEGGGPDGGTSAGGTSGGGTSGGGTSGGGTSGGGTSNGGSSSGTGGSGDVDCSGAFGTTRRTVLEVPDATFSGLTLGPDELELIYSAGMTGETTQRFFSARRASKADAFSDPTPLPELDAACTSPDETRSGDLSFDGLRLYFTCYTSAQPAVTPLRIARRENLDAPFVVDPEPLGTVFGGPTVTRDELELFSALSLMPAAHYQRDDVNEPFGEGDLAAGLEMLTLATPEIAPNGLDLFVSQTTTASSYGLSMARRGAPGEPFGPAGPIIAETPNEVFGSPAISNDCRSLYYAYILAQPLTYRVEVITR